MILALDERKLVSGHRASDRTGKEPYSWLRQGQKGRWDAFVRQYSGLIYHTIKKTFSLHHVEPRPDSVDDLFQEFFLSLIKDDFSQLRRFRGDRGCTLASWLRVIAARRTIDQLRKTKLYKRRRLQTRARPAFAGMTDADSQLRKQTQLQDAKTFPALDLAVQTKQTFAG
jgi:RNA polymerase sigma factor (sigma-70 family)